MKTKYLKNLAGALALATLAACGGSGSCPPGTNLTPGNLTLKIEAPTQYPAGVAVTAYLTMTNTSGINANNLVYSVPAPGESGNNTGVVITPYPNGAGQDCANIDAGASCTFTASIPAGSQPGSFTVLATPNSTQRTKLTTISSKSLQAGSISVTANLGLSSLPVTDNKFYILPSQQTVLANANGTATAFVTVYNHSYTANFSKLNWYNDNGVKISNVILVGTQLTATGTVNTYQVNIPENTSTQRLQLSSGDDNCPLFDGSNPQSACSGVPALINILSSASKIGILSIQPNNFNMSESYASQIVTISNIGNGQVSALQPIESSSIFSETNLNCATTLAVGASCQVRINYNWSSATSNGIATFVVYYNDGVSNVNTSATIPYVAPAPVPAPILAFTPSSISLSSTNTSQTVTLQNTGNAMAILNITAPIAPLSYTTTCGATLAASDNCTFALIVDYSSQITAGAQTFSVAYGAPTPANVAVDWSASPTPASIAVSPTSFNLSSASPSKTITLTNNGQTQATNLIMPALTAPLTESSTTCTSILAANTSCTYTVYTNYAAAGMQVFAFNYDTVYGNVVQTESVIASYESQAGVFAVVAGNANEVDVYSLNKNTGQLIFVESTAITSAARGVTLSPDGKHFYITAVNNIYAYSIDKFTGHLIQTGTAPAVSGFNNMVITPNGQYGYVVNSTYSTGGIQLYTLESNGTVTFTSLAIENLNLPSQIAMSQDGKYLYTAELYGTPSRVLAYGIESTTGNLTQISRQDGLGNYGGGYGVQISPNGTYLYVTTHEGANSGYIYRTTIAGDGTISSLASINYQATSYYQFMTFSPDGLYAYVGYSLSPSMVEFGYDSSNGALSGLTPSLAPVYPSNNKGVQSALVFDPTGTFAYTGSYNAPSAISQFKWNSTNGQLEALSPSMVMAPNPSNISYAIAFSQIP